MSRRRALELGADGIRTAVVLVAALVAWELFVRAQRVAPLHFPPPSRIVARLVELARHGDLVADVGTTLGRLFAGFAVGAAPALALGLAMGSWRRLRRAVDPFVAALHPIPKVTLLPLLFLALGIGEASKIALVALAAFFPMLVGAMAGAREIHSLHFEVARNCAAGRALVLRRIVLPGSLPLVVAGTRLALNEALLMTLVAELLTADRGLGERLWLAWQTLRIVDLYAAIAMVALLGLAIQTGLGALTRLLMPWRPLDTAPARDAATHPSPLHELDRAARR